MKMPSTARLIRPVRLAAALGCLAPFPTGAQSLNLDRDRENDEPRGELPALELLVEGSILQKIVFPQYDPELRLSSVLRAEKLILVNDRVVDTEGVRIEFFHPDRTPRATIDLAAARLYDQQLLRSSDPVSLVAEDFRADGTGLVYELDRSRGFLRGPATARTLIDTRSSMHTAPSPRLGAAGLALVATLHAAEPESLSDREILGLDRLAVSREAVADEAAAKAADQIEESDRLAAGAGESLKEFLSQAAVEIEDGPKPDLLSEVPGPEAEVPFKLPASIRAEKGIFFDSESGVLIFLEKVEIDHPEFTLKGADEVKVFMEKEEPPPDAEKPPADDNPLGGAKFGDPTRVVATGAVRVDRTDPGDGRAIKASGRQMVLDLKTNELIIRGGRPWIIAPELQARMADPDGYFLLNMATGDASAVGRTEGLVEVGENN